MLRTLTITVFLGFFLLLSGCGGGGGSSAGNGASTSPQSNYALLASQAALNSNVNLATNTAVIKWQDTFPAGTVYSIQSVASGTATTLATQAASGTGNTYSWQQSITTSTTFQVTATVGNQTYDMLTAQGQSSVAATIPATVPVITITPDSANLSGTVTLALNSNFDSPQVTWYLDTTLLGPGSGKNGAYAWATNSATNGQHLVLAVINVGSSSTITVRKQVNTTNDILAVNASNSGTSGTVLVDVTASANSAITSVAGMLDGKSLGTLTAPNASTTIGSGTNDLYRFSFSAAAVGSGNHTFVATATDAAGTTQSTSLIIAISNPPVVTLNNPTDGMFIDGTGNLTIAGTATSDKPGGVAVSAYLGSLPISLTRPTPTTFSGSFSLAGLPAGPYTLTLNAKDSTSLTTTTQVSIIVASSAATTYSSNFTLGAGAQLLAVDNSNPDLVLYEAADGSYRIRNTNSSTETILQGTSNTYFYNWTMDGGNVFVEGSNLGSTTAGNTGCPDVCIYQWTPAGVKSNLSTSNPNAKGGTAYEEYPRAHGGYVIWIDDTESSSATYTVYNVATGSYGTIAAPANVNYLGNTQYDFAVVNGVINFDYWAQTGGSGFTYTSDVYQWSSATNSSTMLSGGAVRTLDPQTDGSKVAWPQWTDTSMIGGPASLVARPVAGGVNSTLSNSMLNFKVAAGIVAWTEGSITAPATQTATVSSLKFQNSGGTTITLTTSPTAFLYGIGGRSIVYAVSNKTYSSLSSATDGSGANVLIDTTPQQVMISGSTMYFTLGTVQAVYKITLQ